jgi:Cu2+-exporting ATPase
MNGEHRHEHPRGHETLSSHPHPDTPQVREQEMLEHAAHEQMRHTGEEGQVESQAHAGPAGHPAGHAGHGDMVADFRRRFWISLALTVPILALSPMLQMLAGAGESLRFPGDLYILFALSSAVFFYGGWPFLNGFVADVRAGRPGMMTLISLAITVAYVYSSLVVFGLRGEVFFWELATLIDVMLLGHWVEMRSVMGASRALEELARLMPSEAHRLRPDGGTEDVPLEELSTGQRVLIRPGEKVPVDGEVLEGESSVNEAMLTGESAPVHKKAGDPVIGGSINGEGSLIAEIRKTGKDSYLAQVVDLVRQAQESKSRTQDLANRAALWLTFIAIAAGAATLAVWLAVAGRELAFALERTVTVMVITCPHALGLAIPLVVAVSTAISARNGLLIRNRTAFETARGIQAMIFDKTGTLTEGRFGVTDTLVFGDGMAAGELLRYAAAVEAHSEHPIARGIVTSADGAADGAAGGSADGGLPPVVEFRSLPGRGAEGRVNGRDVKVVSPGYLQERGIRVEEERRVGELSAQGKTVVYVLIDGRLRGAVALADIIRPEAREAIARLKEMGIRAMMLTGDNRRVAQWVAGEIGLDEVFAEVLPHQKAAKVKEVQSRGLVVAMTGDGVNDAPALAQADVGMAIGAGTDVAVETADIVLVRSNPLDAVAIVSLARATYRKMVQNLIWATGYNVVAIPLAAGVLYGLGILLSPALGALFMSLSTVIVAVNARLLKVKR